MITKYISIFALFLLCTSVNTIEVQFDFGTDKDGDDWSILNDGVMGGLSEGEMELTENTLKFSGNVSLENYGGFTSVKSPFTTFDLSASKKLKIKYKAQNQSIAITFENSKIFYRPYYKLELQDTNNQWKLVEIDINDFKEYRLGQQTNGTISMGFLKSIQRIGFITSQKKEGDFTFEVDYLEFE